MRVVVAGAGIAGTMSAWSLARRGCRVTVVDRRSAPATEASGANASQLAYGSIYSLAGPDLLRHLPSVLSGRDPVMRAARFFDPALWLWGVRAVGQSFPGTYERNTARLMELAAASRVLLREIAARHPVEFGFSENGRLRLYGSERGLREAAADAEKRRGRWGAPFEILSSADCLRLNPLLSGRKGGLAGGVLSFWDSAGDCAAFCAAMKTVLEGPEYGVEYRLDTNVLGAGAVSSGRVTCLETDKGSIGGDAFLVCAGASSGFLLRRTGTRLGLYPVKGSTIFVPWRGLPAGPDSLRHSITDVSRRLVLAPLPEGVRISSGMLFAGHDAREDPALTACIKSAAADVVPGISFADARVYTGLRPAVPSGIPVAARTRFSNLYVNAGHGMWGWTAAPATAETAAEMITGRGDS